MAFIAGSSGCLPSGLPPLMCSRSMILVRCQIQGWFLTSSRFWICEDSQNHRGTPPINRFWQTRGTPSANRLKACRAEIASGDPHPSGTPLHSTTTTGSRERTHATCGCAPDSDARESPGVPASHPWFRPIPRWRPMSSMSQNRFSKSVSRHRRC